MLGKSRYRDPALPWSISRGLCVSCAERSRGGQRAGVHPLHLGAAPGGSSAGMGL